MVGDGKRCSTCKQIKNKDNFQKRKNQKDGLNYSCKECCYKDKKKIYTANTEKNKNLIIDPKYTKRCMQCREIKLAENFNKALARNDGLDIFCKPCKKQRKIKYIEKCEEKVLNTVYNDNDPKYCNGCGEDKFRKDFHECNASPDGLQPRCKECCALRINTSTNARARREYLKQYAPISEKDIKNMLESYEYKCAYCHIKVKRGINLHIDHKIPICRNGSHTIDNLAPACAKCNLRKHAKTDVEFIEYLSKKGSIC